MKKISKKIATLKLVALLTIALMAFGVYLARGMDIEYLKENPNAFRFWHYPTMDQIRPVMIELFPVGTSKAFVDAALIDGGGATVRPKQTNPHVFIYSEPWQPWHYLPPGPHKFIFDSNSRVLNFHPRGGSKVYPHQIGGDELTDQWIKQQQERQRREKENGEQR